MHSKGLKFQIVINAREARMRRESVAVTKRHVRVLTRIGKRKWKFSCFRHEETSSEFPEAKNEEDKLPELLVNPEFDQSQAENENWAADAVFSAEPWTVPWTAKTILQVMLLWIASFWSVGSWIIPFLAQTAGFRKESLSYRGQALYSLLTDVAEGVAGIAILHRLALKGIGILMLVWAASCFPSSTGSHRST
ncbi:hypothetical protein CsSME_00001841 [Camellia sinensis var. sinensis]